MRLRAVVPTLLLLGGVAQVALAQHREPSPGDLSLASAAVCAADASARPAQGESRWGASYLDAAAGDASAVAEPSVAPPAPAAPTNSSPAEGSPPAARDACSEVLHAVQFEDVAGAEAAYARCRERVARPGRIPVADDVRTLEDVTEALHSLRREDGTFCVAPGAPFDFRALAGGAADTQSCLVALSRFLASDGAVWRFAVADAYASGRLASRAGVDMVSARRMRRAPIPTGAGERELVAIARLAGRHFMRTCRCLPGPQPDSVTAVRAMHLPSTVETVILRGIEEREGARSEH